MRFNLSVFFTWTGLFLILVAAGVLAYGIGDLQEASVIPGWGAPAFSLIEAVPPGSWYGTLLGGIFNFTPEPTWAQVIGWLAYVIITVSLYLAMLRPSPSPIVRPGSGPGRCRPRRTGRPDRHRRTLTTRPTFPHPEDQESP